MAFPTNATQVQAFAGALYGVQIGSITMAQVSSDIAASGGLTNALNSYYAASFGSLPTATVAASVAANLGLTGDALTAGTAYVEAQLNAAAANARGAVISNILNLFAGLASDATFGAAATAWNAKVDAAAAYTGAANIAIGSTVGQGQTFALTTGANNFEGAVGNDTFTALTINADGAAASTLTAFDSIEGGNGTDTLNIYTEVNVHDNIALNAGMPTTATVKNVEIVNIYNTDEAAALGDASKFAGVTQLWQHGAAANVTNLAATTTAGFKGITTDVSVAAATGVASVAVAVDGLVDSNGSSPAATVVAVSGDALNAVTVTGTVKDGNDSGTTVGQIALAATVGTDVQTLTVNSVVGATITVTTDSTSTKAFTTLDASASTGAITFGGTSVDNASSPVVGVKVASIITGTGNDDVTLSADTNAASGSTAAVGASVSTGAGNDKITVDTAPSSGLSSTTGTTTVDAGVGNDTVAITTRSSGKLTVNLGDGTDSFTSSVAILGTDAIDAGAGTDTLLLSLVGSSNVGAFSNFDVFDVKGMTANLDLDILNTKNTVAEIVGSAAIGATVTSGAANVSLLNVGAGVNFRATADMTYDSNNSTAGAQQGTLTLTQKTAGALTVTMDADETGTADTTIDTAAVSAIASNATSLKAVFDTSYLATITGETTSGDNVSTITLAGAAATALDVVSGGALSKNVLVYTDTAATAGKLASMTISGDRALDLTFSSSNATALTNVDASAQTGGLTFSLANLKNTAAVKLGAGVDHITVTNASTGDANAESVQGLEKALAVAVSTASADSTAKAAAIADADTLVLASSAVADADYNGSSAGDGTLAGGAVVKGVLTFTGSGPATLADAIAIANSAAETAGEAVVFEYVGNSYVFAQGSTTDTVVKLVGITDVTNFVEDATSDNFFIV